MGFNMLFYIIFGTNLLTEAPVPVYVFFPISVFAEKEQQMEWNLRDDLSWNKRNPKDLELKSGTPRGGHRAGGHAQGGRRAPALVGPTELHRPISFAYIYSYTLKTSGGIKPLFHRRNLSVPVRSHLGAFSGDLLEGE